MALKSSMSVLLEHKYIAEVTIYVSILRQSYGNEFHIYILCMFIWGSRFVLNSKTWIFIYLFVIYDIYILIFIYLVVFGG